MRQEPGKSKTNWKATIIVQTVMLCTRKNGIKNDNKYLCSVFITVLSYISLNIAITLWYLVLYFINDATGMQRLSCCKVTTWKVEEPDWLMADR